MWNSRRPTPLDGQGSVIMLVETPHSKIVWTQPRDITLDEALRLFEAPDGLRSKHGGHEMHFITVGLDVGRISSFSTVNEFAARLRAIDATQTEPVALPPIVQSAKGIEEESVPPNATQPDVAIVPFSAQEALNLQQSWATSLGLPVTVVNSLGMKLNLIPPGEFMMGSPDDEPERSRAEGPLHCVRITNPFYMGTTEVTQDEFKCVMGTEASQFSKGGRSSDFVVGVDPKRFPADAVSWSDAVEFCQRLSSLPSESSAGRIYRLPSEAQWEYSCRAGTISRYHFGNSLNGVEANCNGGLPYGTPTKGPYLNRTAAVGSYAANAFGLFDMHGNAWEWCADWYDSTYYRNSCTTDPCGPPAARDHVCRGGGWASLPGDCRSAFRNTRLHSNRSSLSGFRVIMNCLPGNKRRQASVRPLSEQDG